MPLNHSSCFRQEGDQESHSHQCRRPPDESGCAVHLPGTKHIVKFSLSCVCICVLGSILMGRYVCKVCVHHCSNSWSALCSSLTLWTSAFDLMCFQLSEFSSPPAAAITAGESAADQVIAGRAGDGAMTTKTVGKFEFVFELEARAATNAMRSESSASFSSYQAISSLMSRIGPPERAWLLTFKVLSRLCVDRVRS